MKLFYIGFNTSSKSKHLRIKSIIEIFDKYLFNNYFNNYFGINSFTNYAMFSKNHPVRNSFKNYKLGRTVPYFSAKDLMRIKKELYKNIIHKKLYGFNNVSRLFFKFSL